MRQLDLDLHLPAPPPRHHLAAVKDPVAVDPDCELAFILGIHKPAWLAEVAFPTMVSRRTLAPYRTLPEAKGPWVLDSGGFTELKLFGEWRLTVAQYIALVRRFAREVGNLRWAAPMDWMCERAIIQGSEEEGFVGTHLSVAEHQRRTLRNFLELRAGAPDLPWIPVLQGWARGEYLDHLEAYARAGVDLTREPVVGFGSVCRRGATMPTVLLIAELLEEGIPLHCFGFKSEGIREIEALLQVVRARMSARGARLRLSADSMAWSFHASHRPPLPGHDQPGPGRPEGHHTCANCLEYAALWRAKLLEAIRWPDRPWEVTPSRPAPSLLAA
jgi:hypothetical protein